MVDKTPQYTGSFQWIERCDGLIRSFHQLMVENKAKESVKVLRCFHGELLPHFKKEQKEECDKAELNTLKAQSINDITKHCHIWFRLLNQVYHKNGFVMKMNDNHFYSAMDV